MAGVERVGPSKWAWRAMIALVLVAVMLVGVRVYLTAKTETQTNCIARELGGPWIALKAVFEAPPGDPNVSAKAAKAIARSVHRLEHIDRYC